MGYFSRQAIDYRPQHPDHCFVPRHRLLLWRLDDLQDRLAQLQETDLQPDGDPWYPDRELRTILPRDLRRVADVERAILLVTQELEVRCQISLSPEPKTEPLQDELTGAQVTMEELFALAA